MATTDQRRALLAIPCSWCQAAPGEFCSRPAPGHNERDVEDGVRRKTRLPISTLDGGCHDARWQAAGLGTAPVLGEVVAELVERPIPGRVPVSAGADRPW